MLLLVFTYAKLHKFFRLSAIIDKNLKFIPYLMFDVISHANLTKLKILFAGLARFA